ncbi:MAG: hypothetical protein HOP23_12015 [Methylococcaceae bacterium]|nr:hypothetical protein [Methylococcaceae bacterium]
MQTKNHWKILGLTALITVSVLSGCAGPESKDQPVVATTTAPTIEPAPQQQAPETQIGDKPGVIEGELLDIFATVKAINKKKRVVTLKYADGKESKVKCGPEVRNFAQIRVGDEVRASFLDSVELFVTGKSIPSADRTTQVSRAPLGSKPGYSAIDAVEIKATVEAINYQTREVMLKGPEGNVVKIKAGPEVRRLNEVLKGDTVVARLTRAVSIEVSKPD